METVNVEAGLRGLWASLRRVRDLLAWQEVERSERKPGQPPSFRIDSHVEEDLRNEYSFFVKMALDIHEFLNHEQGGKQEELSQRERWKERLCRLEGELRKLGVAGSLIKH